MNIMITGGCGFIGSHLADRFSCEGHEVFIIDDLSSGREENVGIKHTLYKLAVDDIRCEEAFNDSNPHIVIHMAAQTDASLSVEIPYTDTRSNVLGLVNILELSVKYGVKKFVFASSAAVYGNNETLPLSEEMPAEPISPYGMSKLTGEFYCRKWKEIYGLDTVSFRLSNVYGPRQGTKGEGGVVSIFVKKMLGGQELMVFGDGNQTRDFIYVKDVADAFYLGAGSDMTGAFNLSTNVESSINVLIDVLKRYKPINDIVYTKQRAGDIQNSRLDNSRIMHKLKWGPRYNLEKGLEETVNWFSGYKGD